MDAKLQTLKDTFEQCFDIERFIKFSTEFFGGINIINPHRDITNIPAEYKFTAESYKHIASYTSEGNTLDIFAVKLQSGRGRTVERARSMQRSFISKLLSNTNHDAAIAAFYTDDDPRWRLSFVRLDYEFAAGRVKMNLTPAKRYSYLVGENEPCHTAMEQLWPIFNDDNFNPTLNRIEEAFSVEKVTKDFFNEYKEKYFQLKEYLDNSDEFNAEATRCKFTSEQFAKKLMGQLAFLYFLQKKGWLGISVLPHMITEKEYKNAYYKNSASKEIIPRIYKQVDSNSYRLERDAVRKLSNDSADKAAGCFNTAEWGKGEKGFVRHLFKSCKEGNFFDNFLAPLFYEALNQRRGNNNFYKRFICKIPFLNGGLFEPLEKYDWEHVKLKIPNSIFSNIDEKDKREADGILDVFDRYNFTMNEDEPMEREVAVDPEMLGKIFENLLDAKDRKSKGAFYTPREIVHYMCAESLIHYLVGKTGVPYDDMKIFVVDGEYLKDEDYWSDDGTRKLPKSVFDKLREIDRALEMVKVADPAVGSGAFPLGMLSEIIKARTTISFYLAGQIKYPYEENSKQRYERSLVFNRYKPHRLKLETIKNSIFAVDIEASAVDIAKLRLWLSLVVEEDLTITEDDRYAGTFRKDPNPLPNLDYNIMCGNSLIDEFEGIQLFDDTILEDNADSTKTQLTLDLYIDSMNSLLNDLRYEQERLFNEQNTDMKLEIKAKIDKIVDDVIRAKLRHDGNDVGLRRYEESLEQKTKPYFLWKLEFSRVFRENGGFDIVIGNPPYAQVPKSSVSKTRFPYSEGKDKGKQNLYKLFVEHSYNLLVDNGYASMIVQSSLLGDLSAQYTRELLLKKTTLHEILEFPKIASNKKGQVFESVLQGTCIYSFTKKIPSTGHAFKISINNDTTTLSSIEFELIEQGKLIDFYPAGFFIPLLRQGEFDIIVKIVNNSNPLKQFIVDLSQGDLNLSGDKNHFSNDRTEIKLLRGRNIQRYWINYNVDEFVQENHKRAKVQLNQQSRFLVCQEITGTVDKYRLHFAITNTSECFLFGHTSNKVRVEGINIELLLGILNSRLMDWCFRKTSTNNHVCGYEIEQLPITKIKTDNSDKVISITKEIQVQKQTDPTADTSTLEAEIDRIVYELYGLTEEEIKIVEGAT